MGGEARRFIAVVVLTASIGFSATFLNGSGAHAVEISWSDVEADHWARGAIDYVAKDRAWMRDFGRSEFRPDVAESRRLFARALVRAFAPTAEPSGSTAFSDLPVDDPFYRFAAIAVERRWMQAPGASFRPREAVTVRDVHRALTFALGLRREVAGLDAMRMADGTPLRLPRGFGSLALGMVLGLRVDHPQEALEILPSDPLPRAEVAYSLWRAHQASTVSRWRIGAAEVYRDVELPVLRPVVRRVVEFGARYAGYPYVWSGEWPKATPTGYCCGAQPVGGFDCTGIVWWAMKAAEGGYDTSRFRSYSGWTLPERSSAQMAAVGIRRAYADMKPGDLMFFDGNQDGIVDHANVFIGRGWALDSSSSYGGVSIIRVGEGWYRDRFSHARRIIRS